MMNAQPTVMEAAAGMAGDAAVAEAVRVLGSGGVIAFPTDTLYGIGCALDRPEAAERIYRMRNIDGVRRPLTFLLPDLGEVARWAQVTETAFRIMSRIFPGPYCVELAASRKVPIPFLHPERSTMGIRIPDHPFCIKMLWALGKPIVTATAKSRDGLLLQSADEIRSSLGTEVDLVLDGGNLAGPPSTVVSLVDDWVQVLRAGRGPSSRVLTA